MKTIQQTQLYIIKNKAANSRFEFQYDKELHQKAIEGLTQKQCDTLLNTALALCGHPGYKVSADPWNQAQIDFLNLFQL